MDKETYTFEDRMYVNPTTSRDEQLRFVDNLRAIQAEDAARIARDTHNLGTDVTSNLGGLNGSEGIWSQQYVNPQVNSMVASLRSAAQAQALNDVLSNYQNQMQNKYKQAYRAAQKRANSGGGTKSTVGNSSGDGKVTFKPAEGVEVGSVSPNYSPITGTRTLTFDIGGGFTQDVTVTYDEYGDPIKVDAGRNGVYEGDRAKAYLNKMRSLYGDK